MKKVIYNRYGTIDDLQLSEVEMPSIQPDELLIKVKAVAINPLDWKKLEGQLKIITGRKFPKGIAFDFSGVVEKKGAAVADLIVGDAVFGALNAMHGEALAEYIVVKQDIIHKKPDTISFETAASMISVGAAAIYLFQESKAVAGNEIIINGASGGVGLFALQMAKKKGIRVTAVASGEGLTFIKKWSPDRLINYRTESVLSLPGSFNAIFELAGTLPFAKAKKLLKPNSNYVSTLPNPVDMITAVFNNMVSSKKLIMVKAHPTKAIYQELCDWVSLHGLEVPIAKTYSINEYREAYHFARKGSVIGKVVFSL
jgi:NADPH:quinone reductase-like Zn-dependent oxidoreductase